MWTQVHGWAKTSLADGLYFLSRFHRPKVITKQREDRHKIGQVLQHHKSLQISATYSNKKPKRGSWKHLFSETKIVIYQENKTNINKNKNLNKQSENKDSKQSKQDENNKQQEDYV